MKILNTFWHQTPDYHICWLCVLVNVSAEKKADRETDIKKFGSLSALVSFSHYFSFLVLDPADILSPSPPDPGGGITHADSQTSKSAR